MLKKRFRGTSAIFPRKTMMEIISKITLSFLLLLLKNIFEILKNILLNQFVMFFFDFGQEFRENSEDEKL